MYWCSPRPRGPRFARCLGRPRDRPLLSERSCIARPAWQYYAGAGLARLRAIADYARTARPHGYDLEARSHHRGAVLHRTQTETAGISAGVFQALTIVANLQSDVLALDVEGH